MKIAPVIDAFIDFIKGSSVFQETGAAVLRYDTVNTEEQAIAAAASEVGFCYVVRLNQVNNDYPEHTQLGSVRYDISVICIHSGTTDAIFDPLQATEILTDLFGYEFQSNDGALIQTFSQPLSVELLVDDEVIAHSVNFNLVRTTLT